MLSDSPAEFQASVREFFPEEEWENASEIARLESGWNAFAIFDTTDASHPCGYPVGTYQGTPVSAERSIGYFQINSCNFPDWEWQRLYNARHNVGTAHMLWENAGGWS